MKKKIKDKVIEVMHGDRQTGNKGLQFVLRAISIFYAAGVALRAAVYRCRLRPIRKLPCFVISVGNITLGGTGKSPMVVYLAEMLRGMGYEVAVISRGYMGSAEKSGGMISDGRRLLMGPDAAGDEPYMMARALLDEGVPVLVGQDRIRSGMLAVGHFRPHVILMDDGFQHCRLYRDLDIVLLDSQRPLGNGFLFPRGSLREPVSALKRADMLMMTRSDRATSKSQNSIDRLYTHGSRRKLFRSCHLPYLHAAVTNQTSEHRAASI